MSTKLLQINFALKVPTADYESLCKELAATFAAIPGLRWKIWISNEHDKSAGGIYLFESEAALNAFLSSPLAASVQSHPALSDFNARIFDIMDEVTNVTRGPVKSFAAAA